jgi:putative oxidoreductase
VAAGGALVAFAAASIGAPHSVADVATWLIPGIIGALLLVGLWTPVVGVLAAFTSVWIAYLVPARVPFWLLESALGVALALVGPGAWSLDARLFGWKRVEIRNGEGGTLPPE